MLTLLTLLLSTLTLTLTFALPPPYPYQNTTSTFQLIASHSGNNQIHLWPLSAANGTIWLSLGNIAEFVARPGRGVVDLNTATHQHLYISPDGALRFSSSIQPALFDIKFGASPTSPGSVRYIGAPSADWAFWACACGRGVYRVFVDVDGKGEKEGEGCVGFDGVAFVVDDGA